MFEATAERFTMEEFPGIFDRMEELGPISGLVEAMGTDAARHLLREFERTRRMFRSLAGGMRRPSASRPAPRPRTLPRREIPCEACGDTLDLPVRRLSREERRRCHRRP